MKRVLAALFVVVIAMPALAREGFGFKKKAVSISRTIPPATNAGARRVQVTVESERGADRDDAQTLQRYISDAVLAGAGTLAEGAKPEVTLQVSIDRLDSHETWETYTDYERRQTGTKQEWNESKKRYDTKPVYTNVAVQKQRKVLEADLTGVYDISAKSRDVTGGTIDERFREKYGDYDTAPTPTSLEDDLLKRAALKVAAQIVPTQQRVNILIPRASFEPLIPLAENGAWDRYLDAVEAMPPKKNAKEEAYRQYALAVAKEALAYGKTERGDALELLRAARSHYEVASTSNVEEELFRKGYVSLLSAGDIGSPLARAGDSVTRYEAWTAPPPAAPKMASSSSSSPPEKATPAKSKGGMRNQTVIDLAKAGLSDENIVLAIDGASQTQFDVSPEGLIALSKGGVSKSVIAHMQRKKSK